MPTRPIEIGLHALDAILAESSACESVRELVVTISAEHEPSIRVDEQCTAPTDPRPLDGAVAALQARSPTIR